MKKSKLLFFGLLMVAAVVSCSKDPEGGTVPLMGPGGPLGNVTYTNNGGNVTCDEVLAAVRAQCGSSFVFAHTSGKIDYYGGGGGTVGPITWTTDGTYINWTSSVPVKVAIIVKGGPSASVYFSGCEACVSSGTALHAPLGPSGNPYGLSNITFCYNVCEPPAKKLAFKSYTTSTWVVTGGGPANNDFIGCVPFVSGASYPLYMGGLLANPSGTLEIGNFDGDPLFEVRITSTIAGLNFTNAYLYVGLATLPCNTDYINYPYTKMGINASVAIFDLPF